jgi:hypothetical protein
LKRLISCCIALAICLVPKASAAVQGAGLSAYPSHPNPNDPTSAAWFRYHLAVGQDREDSLTVANDSGQIKSLSLYPVDADATEDGQLAMRNQTEPQRDVGRWIELASSHITLQPAERETVPFRIVIPRDASVGDHIGGIVIQEDQARSETTAQGVHLQILSRLAVRVYETIPGASILQLKVDGYHLNAARRLVTHLTLANNGNTTIAPSGQISFNDLLGRPREQLTLPPVVLLPHHRVRLVLTSSLKQPIFERYQGRLRLVYSGREVDRTATVYWYDPSRSIFFGLIIVLLSLVGWWLYRKSRFGGEIS